MNSIPKSERKHIVLIGRKNAGKSSLMNALLGQNMCIVSETPGTTLDPVKKSVELPPYGSVVLVDTAGIEDIGELGERRLNKTLKALAAADFAVIVLDGRERLSREEKELFLHLNKISLSFLVAVNKIEFGVNPALLDELKILKVTHFEISCAENVGIDLLKSKITRLLPNASAPPLIGDLVTQGDIILLVVPLDSGVPDGRLIVPQIQAVTEALDGNSIIIVAKEKELRSVLYSLKNYPDLVVTDNHAIIRVAAELPDTVKLTTFSILMTRYKADLNTFIKGLQRIEELEDGDKVLIAEACTHHPKDDNTGNGKIPEWLKLHTKKKIEIHFTSGGDFPQNLSSY
ncbi:MAG: [FeFe] hydrogenase H-cluster maturation GTPase HydF, partial [Ignavibacteria bacterium]